MKGLKYNLTMLFMGLAIMAIAYSPSRKVEHSKTIEEEFSIRAGGVVGVEHRYGDVEFISISSGKVKYVVTIDIFTESEEKAQETFDNVRIDFEERDNSVYASTKRNKNKSSWWDKVWNNSSESYEINYKVYVPQNVKIDVENRYGNVYIDDRESNVRAEVKYGDLNMGDVRGLADLDLAYTSRKAKVGSLDALELDISYSEFEAKYIKDGNIDSKYSELEITEAINLEIESKYDDYYIKKVANLENDGMYDDFRILEVDEVEIESKYTDIDVDLLHAQGIFDVAYGEIAVKEISKALETLNIDSDYTDLKFKISAAFLLDLESKYTDVKLPSKREVISLDKESNRFDIKAHINGPGKAEIIIDMSYGSLKVKD